MYKRHKTLKASSWRVMPQGIILENELTCCFKDGVVVLSKCSTRFQKTPSYSDATAFSSKRILQFDVSQSHS